MLKGRVVGKDRERFTEPHIITEKGMRRIKQPPNGYTLVGKQPTTTGSV
jgi:hypothetical protein